MIHERVRPEAAPAAYNGNERRTALELVPIGVAVHPRGVNPT